MFAMCGFMTDAMITRCSVSKFNRKQQQKMTANKVLNKTISYIVQA